MRVLYDGWSLVHDPLSPESLHLLAILDHLPPEIEPVVVFPAQPLDWVGGIESHVFPTPSTSWGRLQWGQYRLPACSRALAVEHLHLVAPRSPIWGDFSILLSPTGFGAGMADWSGLPHQPDRSNMLPDRLRRSLSQGGLVRLGRVLWPGDLPAPGLKAPLERLPPILPRGFYPNLDHSTDHHHTVSANGHHAVEQLQLPDDFILYQGPGGQRPIEILVQAWHWCMGAIGEYYPLLVLGLDERDHQTLSEWIEVLDFGDTLRIIPGVTPDMLPRIYQLSTAVFHPTAASPWCGPVRLSLASGKPLVAAEHDLTAAITGSAAYLGSATDARALGAALVTVVVEEQVARRLSGAAEQRVQNWKSSQFGSRLGGIYRALSQAG